MNSRNDPTNGPAVDPTDDEARIRADERARVEQELSDRGDDRPGDGGAVTPENRVAADERALAEDRAAADDRPLADDRAAATDRPVADDRTVVDDRTAAEDPVAADDRVDRDRDGVDDRAERHDRTGDDRVDRDRDGVDDRAERHDRIGDDRVDRDRDGVDDRIERDDRRDTPVGGVPPADRDERLVGDGERVIRDDEQIEVVRTRSFSIGQLLTMLAGAALVVLGVFALVDTGIDTPLDEQVGEVLGWDHTALLGIVEIAAGALLVIFSLRPGGRWLVAVVGLALLVGGVMILGELDFTVDTLGAEQSFGWVPIVAGLIALFASLVTPRRHQRMTGIPAER